MTDRILKRVPNKIWKIAIDLVKERKEIYEDFKNWLYAYIESKLNNVKSKAREFERNYINAALEDDNIRDTYISEYIWHRYGTIEDFTDAYEEIILNRLEPARV